MTFRARYEAAQFLKRRLSDHHVALDVELLATNTDYARAIENICTGWPELADCLPCVSALVDALALPKHLLNEHVSARDCHPAFADTVADQGP